MVQQHCYSMTEKGGKTVARSAGLSDKLIKEHLHPLCYYHPSRKMQALRLPIEEFPRNLMVAHLPDGHMLFGQSICTSEGFFCHQFITAKPIPLSLILPTLYHALFLTSTAWDELPELDNLPLIEGELESAGPLPFDSNELERLAELLEVETGEVDSKRACVILPDQDWVRPVLMWLYSRLSEDAASTLGFSTYNRQPPESPLLQLVFLEKGYVHSCSNIFDFDKGAF